MRHVVEDDMPFLRKVYASTRQPELDLLEWAPTQKDAFLEMQSNAQQAHYRLHYPKMDRLVVSHCYEPIGRLYLDRGPTDHAIVDIAFLSDYRGRGYGTALLRDLLDEAGRAGRSVTIHVEKSNPAKRLYQRLGFAKLDDRGVYERMRWTPDQTACRFHSGIETPEPLM